MAIFQGSLPGKSAANWLGIAVVAIVVLLSAYVVVQSFQQNQRAQNVFDGWLSDAPGYAKATAAYENSNQPLIVYFFADWCPHCKHLKETVLSTPEFQAYARKFIRVKIQPDNGNAERALMDQYGATGYPAFFVIPAGKPANVPFEAAATRIETYTPDGAQKNAAQFTESIDHVLEGAPQ